MSSLPTGTVTLLFTDIEGSTGLLEYLGDRYAHVLTDYRRLLRAAFQEHRGQEVDTQGDTLFTAFARAKDALSAAIAGQRSVLVHQWPEEATVRVRMGLHTGEPLSAETGYVGIDVHRAARICAAGYGGQILLSEATCLLVEDELTAGVALRDLGEYRLKDLARPQHLFQVVAADLPTNFPPLKTLNTLPNNLPLQLTSFIGREREMAEVKRLLSTTRLLTLTGSGGAGKTRLALQVTAELLEEFNDGVWQVELASLSDPSLVPQVVASVLNVREQPDQSILATVSDYLQRRDLLLVLDNAEHLVAACAHLADDLLRACPRLRILVTSRERLGIAGETVWRVPSLPLPDRQHIPPLEDFIQNESVRLFVERAAANLPTFRMRTESALAVAEVCHQLDGIPLAIELAAGRVAVLSPEQIANKLNDRFRLLTGGSRTALPRHQTLRAAIDWSYDLLSEKEQALLRRLSAFAGGWTLEAAEAVCTNGAAEFDVFNVLTSLVHRSLVIVEEQGREVRYSLLETIRQYGREKLVESREEGALRTRHRDWFLGLAERMESKRWGSEQTVGLERLETEHDNLRAALEWSLTNAATDAVLRLASALGWFWHIRGYWGEGRDRLKAALSISGSSAPYQRARALFWAGRLASLQQDYKEGRILGDEGLAIFRELGSKRDMASLLNDMGLVMHQEGGHEGARSLFQESLAIFRELGEKEGLGWTLDNLGMLARDQGDFKAARTLFSEALILFRELGSKRGTANALWALGSLALDQGDHTVAHALYEEALGIFRELGDKEGIGRTVRSLATVLQHQGDYTAAHRLYQEALGIFRELGNRDGIGWVTHGLATLAQHRGDYATARHLYEESLAIVRALGERESVVWTLSSLANVERLQSDHGRSAAHHAEALSLLREIGNKLLVVECLERYAYLALATGQLDRAARFSAVSVTARDAMSIPLPLSARADHDCAVTTARTGLGEEAFATAWAAGRAMTLQEAIEYALADEV